MERRSVTESCSSPAILSGGMTSGLRLASSGAHWQRKYWREIVNRALDGSLPFRREARHAKTPNSYQNRNQHKVSILTIYAGLSTIQLCRLEKNGPTRTRTWNQGIMSPLL